MENEITELKTQLTIIRHLKKTPTDDTSIAPHVELVDFDTLSETLSKTIELLETNHGNLTAARTWFERKMHGLHRAGIEMALIPKNAAIPDTESQSIAHLITQYENLKRTLSPSIGSTGPASIGMPTARRSQNLIQYKS